MTTLTAETVVKERPILFSAPMVRAILDGKKTQTRRIVKADFTPEPARIELWRDVWVPTSNSGKVGIFEPDFVKCPYGKIGDRLWVRETWSRDHLGRVLYRQQGWLNNAEPWKPSIFMPRNLSRITLEITGIRCERLQEISEADAKAEGVTFMTNEGGTAGWGAGDVKAPPHTAGYSYRNGYKQIWQSINGADSWAANPFVWVIEFKRLENN